MHHLLHVRHTQAEPACCCSGEISKWPGVDMMQVSHDGASHVSTLQLTLLQEAVPPEPVYKVHIGALQQECRWHSSAACTESQSVRCPKLLQAPSECGHHPMLACLQPL